MPMVEIMEAVDPDKVGRKETLPPLSLLRVHSMDREKVEEIKEKENIPVIVVFPARGDEELLTLEREIQILQPLMGRIIDEIWIAFGGSEHDDVPLMANKYGVQVPTLVYHRPFGGRLNAFIPPFISIFDHPAINPLKNLLYFLSGEIAGTLNFWLSVPFKQNFGIEMKILTSLALNKVNLCSTGNDLGNE